VAVTVTIAPEVVALGPTNSPVAVNIRELVSDSVGFVDYSSKLLAGMVDEGTWRLPLEYVGGGWQTVELSQPKLEALVDAGAAVQVVEGTMLTIGLIA